MPLRRVGGSGDLEAMREILTDVLTWSRLSEPHGYDFNGWLVRTPTGNVCIDPVEPGADDLAELARLGVASIVRPGGSRPARR